jgi:hypothetical protein
MRTALQFLLFVVVVVLQFSTGASSAAVNLPPPERIMVRGNPYQFEPHALLKVGP